jgi:hypothetical protein
MLSGSPGLNLASPMIFDQAENEMNLSPVFRRAIL